MTSVRVIGPGRAGSSFAGALEQCGWTVKRPLGRTDDLAKAAHGTDVLVIATPDAVIRDVARQVDPDPSTLVLHLSGTLPLDALEPHHRVASIHPLMSLPDAEVGARRLLAGTTFAVDGDPEALDVVGALGGRVVEVAAQDRAVYHAAAAVASNHTVALMAQVERLAATIGVPLEAYLDLASASIDNVRAASTATDALTGPAARNDIATLESHRDAMPPAELELYATLSIEAGRLAGHDQRPTWNQPEADR